MTPGYDVFLCYKWEDKESAEALRTALEDRGLRVFCDEIGLDDWDPLTETIRAALRSSRTLVALVTPHFPISPHCRQELLDALTASYYLDAGSTRRVLAVTQGISADQLRPRELSRFRLPRDGKPSTALADELVRTIGSIDHRTFGEAPNPAQPQWWPGEGAGDSFFHGRGAELWELHEGLRARDKDRDRGLPIVSVRAPGGAGKTALCLQYARWFAQDHPGGVFLIRLQGSDPRFAGGDSLTRSAYLARLAEMAAQLGLHQPPGPWGPLVAIREMLSAVEAPYLWIVDDVPSAAQDLVQWISAPTPLGKTLLTTRGSFAGKVSQEIELGELEPAAAASILTSRHRATAGSQQAVRRIVDLLDAHPLGLTLASGLTTHESFDGYPGLLETLSTTEPDALEFAAHLGDPTGASFSKTLLRSFETLDDHTQRVMVAASVLAPVPIPVSLISHMLSDDRLAEALAQAGDRGLITAIADQAFVMHALTARGIRIYTGSTVSRERLRSAALSRLTAVVEGDQLSRADVLQYLPHVRAVVGLLPGGDSKTMNLDDRHLLNETGRVQVQYGQTSASVASFEALYEACARSSDVDAITRHIVLVGLAVAVGINGELTRALTLKHQAVEGLAAELDPNDRDTWTARNNLAVSYYDAREYDAAHDLFRQVHTGRRNQLGPSHRDTLVALGNLAIVHARLGGSPRSRRRHQLAGHRLLLIAGARWRQVAPLDDPEVLDLLNSLALSHRRLGEPAIALALLKTVRSGRIDRLGADHPDTLDACENLIVLQHELNEPEEPFQELFLRRLEVQGPTHPATMTTMLNLLRSECAALSSAADDHRSFSTVDTAEGEPVGEIRLDGDHVDLEIELGERAVHLQDACESSYGVDDPRTMAAVTYLAYCLAVSNHLDEQLDQAAILIADSYDGLADALDDAAEGIPPETVTTAFLERESAIADRIRQWVSQALEDVGE